ncbi:hypothetical protein BT69DRAFT_727807 [Atractiella rhizophila]|nr:hypothetical protein BT69DRAFT_727807 [Atractiella rhizophila]
MSPNLKATTRNWYEKTKRSSFISGLLHPPVHTNIIRTTSLPRHLHHRRTTHRTSIRTSRERDTCPSPPSLPPTTPRAPPSLLNPHHTTNTCTTTISNSRSRTTSTPLHRPHSRTNTPIPPQTAPAGPPPPFPSQIQPQIHAQAQAQAQHQQPSAPHTPLPLPLTPVPSSQGMAKMDRSTPVSATMQGGAGARGSANGSVGVGSSSIVGSRSTGGVREGDVAVEAERELDVDGVSG